jgi:type I restriction enzyme S subunit
VNLAEIIETAAPVRRFKPYPDRRDSGVEWLGEIPTDWDLKRLKRIAQFRGGGTPTKDRADYWGGEIPWVSPKDMKVSVVIDTEDKITPQALRESATNLVPAGAVLLVVRSGILIHSIPVALAGREVTLNQDLKAILPGPKLRPEYLYYLVRGLQSELLVEWKKEGATVESLEVDLVEQTKTPLPPLTEQRAIAAFLDRETARIDALVPKKEKLIGLLQEQRTALITRAVTKGLDPNAPMKHSGIEWLGEIPAYWEVERLKWAARMESGHTPDKKIESYWQNGDIPWVSLADTGQLREVDFIEHTAVMTTADGIAHSSAHLLPPGTVVFSRDATIGLCAITRMEMAVSQHFIGWVCGHRLKPEYLLFVLRSMTQEMERLTMGATVRTIGMPDVRSLVTPIPPIPEQEQIIQYVYEHRSELDLLINKIRGAIDRLLELRTAIISAAVTGKIDVRGEIA